MKYLQLTMMLSGWFMRASADGKITSGEILQAVLLCAETAGVKLEIDLRDFNDSNVTM